MAGAKTLFAPLVKPRSDLYSMIAVARRTRQHRITHCFRSLSSSSPHDDGIGDVASVLQSRHAGVELSTTPVHDNGNDLSNTIVKASLFKNPIVQQLWTARQAAKDRRKKSQPATGRSTKGDDNELPGKPPSASRVQVHYPFQDDEHLLEAYRNPWNGIRMGKIFEDLDALAGNIAFFHVDNDTNDVELPVIVTASVDRIQLHQQRPTALTNQVLSGQVTWTGTSSMEIRMQCCTEQNDDDDDISPMPWLEAYVTFVTLDPHTHRPMRIPQVLPQDDIERHQFDQGAARAAAKKRRRKRSSSDGGGGGALCHQEQEQALATKLLRAAGPLLNMPSLANPHQMLLQHTRLSNALMAQPQVQNLHERVFGGFLMRRAFELAFANAYLFGGARPLFIEVDEVSFAHPVNVGDLLVFYSRVLYVEDPDGGGGGGRLVEGGRREQVSGGGSGSVVGMPKLHIEVEAWVTEPEQVSAKLSNSFYFTFCVDTSRVVRQVLPANLDEAQRVARRMLLDREQDDETESEQTAPQTR